MIREFLKKVLSTPAISCIRVIKKLPITLYERYLICTQPRLHRKAEERLRKKEGPINVVFFAIFKSVWKYDNLYKLLKLTAIFLYYIIILILIRRLNN